MNISGKTFLVTGGSSGLGAACARELHGAGANVVLLDIGEHGAALASELGAKARFVKTDVTDETQVGAAIGVVTREFGALHGAINCAGIATAERAVGKEGPQPLAHFARVISVNLIGTWESSTVLIALPSAWPRRARGASSIAPTAELTRSGAIRPVPIAS